MPYYNYDNQVRATFKLHGVLHPDKLQMSAFYELVGEDLGVPEWICQRDDEFVHRVLARVADRLKNAHEAKLNKAAAKVASQQPLPTKTEGN